MNAAFLRHKALSEEKENRGGSGISAPAGKAGGAEGGGAGEEEEEEERATLARVEALADKFCEQVMHAG